MDSGILSLTEGPRGGSELQLLELAANRPSWSLPLPEVSFSSLVEPITIPRSADGGWALLLRISNPRRASAWLHLLLVSDEGELLDSLDTPGLSVSRYDQEIHLLDGRLLLRNDNTLTLYAGP